jgi:hypothetical protein
VRSEAMVPSIGDWSKKSHAEFIEAIRSAMARIEREIEDNHGVYPSRLSVSEVCRRAGVDRATMGKPTHKNSTLVEVFKWLEKMHHRLPKDAKARRSAGAKRAETYKARLEGVCQQYHEAELEMISLRKEVESLKAQLATLASSNPKVVSMHGKREA